MISNLECPALPSSACSEKATGFNTGETAGQYAFMTDRTSMWQEFGRVFWLTLEYASLLELPKPQAGALALVARHCWPEPLLKLRVLRESVTGRCRLGDFLVEPMMPWDRCVPFLYEHSSLIHLWVLGTFCKKWCLKSTPHIKTRNTVRIDLKHMISAQRCL